MFVTRINPYYINTIPKLYTMRLVFGNDETGSDYEKLINDLVLATLFMYNKELLEIRFDRQ